MAENPQKIILASASPRRREIMQSMGLKFEIRPADIDESAVRAIHPRMLVRRLSKAKAEAERVDGAIVVGADTVVVLRGRIYGKPHTRENAIGMLGKLCGKWHIVYTGVTVIGADGCTICFSDKSRVRLKDLSEKEILEYVDRINPLDKAGAYGIQDGVVVEKYEGSYTNIVGLPQEKLAKAFARVGVDNVNG